MNSSQQSRETCECKSIEKLPFYCDTCKKFICVNCFANSHRKHESNTNKNTIIKWRELVKNYISVRINKSNIDDLLSRIVKINDKLQTMKKNLNKKTENLNSTLYNIIRINSQSKINNVISSINDEIERKCLTIFQLVDKIKYLQEKTDHEDYNEVLSMTDTRQIIEYSKEKRQFLDELTKVLESKDRYIHAKKSLYFINLLYNFQDIKNRLETILKQQTFYYNSILNNINLLGSSSYNFLRRFNSFSVSDILYFKKTCMDLSVSRTIRLIGVSVCSIFVKDDSKNKKEFKFALKIFQQDNLLSSKEVIFSNLYNKYDPTIICYLDESIKLTAGSVYHIELESKENNNYYTCILGKVPENVLDLCQTIKWNQDLVFTFKKNKSEETDLNELKMGVLSDIIFIN